MFDTVFFVMLAVLAALAALTYARGGAPQLGEGIQGGVGLLLRFGPVLVVSFLAAGLIENLVPAEWVQRTLGRDAGVRGIVLAACAGLITPAGPFVSMPLAAVLLKAGASAPAVVAYLSAWSLLSLHRFVAWELPILEPRFAVLRYGVAVVLVALAPIVTRLFVR